MSIHCGWGLLVVAVLVVATPSVRGEDGQPIDMNRAKELMLRRQAGETLTTDENSYLNHALQIRRQHVGQTAQHAPASTNTVKQSAENLAKLVPLTELTESYKGEDGGLYGAGSNEPPAAHRSAHLEASKKIRPLDANGEPSDEGKIGLITIGFSNPSIESEAFKRAADIARAQGTRSFELRAARVVGRGLWSCGPDGMCDGLRLRARNECAHAKKQKVEATAIHSSNLCPGPQQGQETCPSHVDRAGVRGRSDRSRSRRRRWDWSGRGDTRQRCDYRQRRVP